MKKFFALFFFVIIIFTLSFSACAYKIGDKVGYALKTDIVAKINGYEIPSYNVNGYTYVIAEDLNYYGFSVLYDYQTRTLSTTRDFSQSWASKVYTKPYVAPSNVGTKEHNLLYTDIKTYLDGYYTDSYNIDGQTIIRFDSLSFYGNVYYDNNKREISLDLPGFNYNPNPFNRSLYYNTTTLSGTVHEVVDQNSAGNYFSTLVFDFDAPKLVPYHGSDGITWTNRFFTSIQITIDNYSPDMKGKHLEIIDYSTPFEAHNHYHIRPIVMLDAKVKVID